MVHVGPLVAIPSWSINMVVLAAFIFALHISEDVIAFQFVYRYWVMRKYAHNMAVSLKLNIRAEVLVESPTSHSPASSSVSPYPALPVPYTQELWR